MSAFTPGPWNVAQGGTRVRANENKSTICDCDASNHLELEQMQANAKLIAAAPCMIEALQEAEAGLELACAALGYDSEKTDGFIPSPVLALQITRAAIARATGKEPQ